MQDVHSIGSKIYHPFLDKAWYYGVAMRGDMKGYWKLDG